MSCARARVVAVKVQAELFAAALNKLAIMEAWEGGKDGDSIVETNVSQSDGSKASLAEVGLMAPSHERGFQKSLLLEVVHLHTQGGVLDRVLVFLWQVKLALLLEACAGVALTQDLEGRPMLGELLSDTLLGRDDILRGLLGLLVLRAGGH